ncbi:hypothetical protein BDV34DRAFT_129164 [Aspergillus parasiticus]|uniref:Uncharacterized protein n=1 Tax=Aspergillus parasiticus TaxID=5067 RepID=A0A5N6DES6_ASPPA|nr:hypothetical protein BDV34DRAFT_129164 [Aspergillus parasiticus]
MEALSTVFSAFFLPAKQTTSLFQVTFPFVVYDCQLTIAIGGFPLHGSSTEFYGGDVLISFAPLIDPSDPLGIDSSAR